MWNEEEEKSVTLINSIERIKTEEWNNIPQCVMDSIKLFVSDSLFK